MNNYICIENGSYIEIKDDKGNIRNLKVACIFDSFTTKCYEGIVDLIAITPDNWKYKMLENRPDIFMIESAWSGENNSWRNIISSNWSRECVIIKNIIEWCKKNDIPTIFWNKEDPINYNYFIANAKLFDYIFTTDENSIDKYRSDVSHNRIYTLTFAASPRIHNPIKSDSKNEKSFFAGTYYRTKFNERKNDLKKLLNLAIEYTNLDIYDRHYNENNPIYEFPKQYHPYIKGYLEFDKMCQTYKKYKIALNVNCVKNSPTMFSRRVYECILSGTPVISTYSLGINKEFKGLVVSSDNMEDLRDEFIKLKDDRYYYDKVLKGIREVLSYHTYENRLVYILNKIGMKVISKIPTLAVLVRVDNIDEYEILRRKYKEQTYKYKKLYVITMNKLLKDLNKNDVEVIFINKYDKKTQVDNLFNEDYIGFLNINNIYGKFYFEDLVNARLYTDSDIIGKKSYYNVDKNNKYKLINKDMDFRYVDEIDFDKCIINQSILKTKTIENLLKYIDNNKISNLNCTFFSIDKSNLIVN